MESTEERPIRAVLHSALLAAMRRRDSEAISVCRTTVAAIDNAEAVPLRKEDRAGAIELSAPVSGASEAPRRLLSEAEVRQIVRREAADLRVAAASSWAPGVEARLCRQADLLDELLAPAELP